MPSPRDYRSEYEPFNWFIKSTLKHFRFLEVDYGFEVTKIGDAAHECAVYFENVTTGVEIRYEIPEPPVVSFARILRPSGIWRNQYGLHFLIEERCPEMALARTLSTNLKQDLGRFLAQYARVTKEYALDILTGDFSVLPQLEKRYRTWLREMQMTERRRKGTKSTKARGE